MDFSSVLPTFVITLREGVEAALVVGIVLGCLKKAGQSHLNRWVYLGIFAGIVISFMIGGLFGWIIQLFGTASPAAEQILEGIFSLVAIALLSWMLIWMTEQAKYMKKRIEGDLSSALASNTNSAWGVFSLILVAVLREGFETVVFIVAKFQQGIIPALGAITGIAVAALMGVLLFKWGVKLDIRKFFQVMGVLLLLIIAGLVVTALGHFDGVMSTLASQSRASQSLCFYYQHFAKVHSCVLGPPVWDLSKILPDDRFPGLVLSALFGYTQRLYLVQAIAYITFLLGIGVMYWRSLGFGQKKPQLR